MSAIVQLRQGSDAWLAYRLSKRNASESAAVMGVSPWVTPYRLWQIKTGRYTQPVNAAMQRGTDLEPAARRAYEEQTGLIMQPLVLEDGPYSASLDGMTLEGDLIVEIKCPYKGQASDLWQGVACGEVPEHYLVQVQHQLMVSGAALAHFWVYDGQQGLLHEIRRDDLMIRRIQNAWDAFEVYLAGDTPPPLTDADTVVRDDPAWLAAAEAYRTAKTAVEAATERLEAAKLALVALACHAKESGAGVSVTRFWKAGNVDYKKVPALRGVDLDAYRGKGREEVRVTATG